MKRWIIGPAFMVFLSALTVGVANATPNGNGVCYTSDGLCVAGRCDVVKGTDLSAALDGYHGEDGIYPISPTCENRSDLSNVIVEGVPYEGNCGVKAEYEFDGLFPEIMITVIRGKPVTAFSVKCGTQCIWYGENFLECNEIDLP